MWKKIGIIFGIVLLMLLGLAVIVPFVVDVNDFRPQIVDSINRSINGKISIGKIDASIWRGITLHDVKLTNPEGFTEPTLISVSKADLTVNLVGLVIGDVRATAKFSNSTITVERSPDLGWNIARIMKSESEKVAETSQPSNPGIVNRTVNNWIKTAHVGFKLRNATILYLDQVAGKKIQLNSVNLELGNVSLNSLIDLNLEAEIDSSLMEGVDTKGRISYKGTIFPHFSSDGSFQTLSFNGDLDLTKMLLVKEGSINKQPGTDFKISLKGEFKGSDKTIVVNSFHLTLANLDLIGNAKIPTADLKSFSLKAQAKDFDIVPLRSISPLIMKYLKSGIINASYEGSIVISPPGFEGRGDLMGKNVDVTFIKTKAKEEKIKLEGDGLFNTNLTFSVSGKSFSKLHGTLNADLTNVALNIDPDLKKKPGIPLKVDTNFNLEEQKLGFENAKIIFNNLIGKAHGNSTLTEPKMLDISLVTEEIPLQGWNDILPKLGKINPAGSIIFQKLKIAGPLSNLMSGTVDADVLLKHILIGAELLNGEGADGLVASGPMKADGTLSISLKDKKLTNGNSKLTFNLDDAQLKKEKVFFKAKSKPLNGKIDVSGSEDHLIINSALVRAINADFKISGEIVSLKTLNSKLKIEAKPFQLSPWTTSLDYLKEFPLSATVEGTLKIDGPLKDKKVVKYGGFLKLTNGSGRLKGFNPPVSKLDAEIKFTDNGGVIDYITANLGESDLKITGTLTDFENPKGTISIASNYANLDELFPPVPETPPTSAPDQINQIKNPLAPQKVSSSDTFRIFREIPFLKKASFKGDLKITKFLSRKMTLGPLVASLNYRQQRFTLEDFSLGIYDGSISANSEIDTSKVPAPFTFWGSTRDIDLEAMLAAKNPKLKGTVSGKLSSDFHLSGAGFSQAEIRRNLSGRGKLSLFNAEFKTIDFTDSIYASLESIPGVKLRERPKEKRFQFAKAQFVVQDGKVSTDDLYLRGQGFSVKGRGYFDFDQNLNYRGDYFLSPQEDPLEAIPFKVTGNVSTPSVKPDITEYARRYLQSTIEDTIKKGAEKLIEEINR